jgi:transposase
VRRSPRLAGRAGSRWRLADLAAVLPWLRGRDPSTIRRIARRLGVRARRGRVFLHSPDPAYDAKLAAITAAQCFAHADPAQVVLLYEDEFTYARRPTVAAGYAPIGSALPAAPLGQGANTRRRIAGCLDASTGRFHAWQRARFDRFALRRFYRAVAAAYPAAEHIYLVHDNWPVHVHPDLVDGLADSRLHLLRLPTYAPWTNPVEQVWRGLNADLLHLHPFADDWDGLRRAIDEWLRQWTRPSPALLQAVGLCPH